MNMNITILVLYVLSGIVGIFTSIKATLYNPTDWIVYYYKSTGTKT